MFKYVILELFCRKGRRKDKDSPTPPAQEESKRYLEDTCIKERVTDADFFRLVSLPQSLDYNEWLATHGTDSKQSFPKKWGLIARHFVSLFFGGGGQILPDAKSMTVISLELFQWILQLFGDMLSDIYWFRLINRMRESLGHYTAAHYQTARIWKCSYFFHTDKKNQNCNWYVSCRHNFVYLLNRI